MKGYNCPNCGAPIDGPTCEYCGTVFVQKDEEGNLRVIDAFEQLSVESAKTIVPLKVKAFQLPPIPPPGENRRGLKTVKM